MPASKSSAQHPLRDSWLSAQMLLQPSVERDDAEIEDLSLAAMDEDPLIYFLTPTPSTYTIDEGMDFDMDFDAGIEDAKHPPQIIRSVSPSSLGGLLSRPPPAQRPPTPPRSPATPDLDYDLSATPDEHEQYDYMMENSWRAGSSSSLSLPRRLKDKFKGHGSSNTDNLVVPYSSSPRPSSSRGRATSRAGPKPVAAGGSGNTRRSHAGTTTTSSSSSRLSPHAWREPSPDVWDIEEEPEEEVLHSGSEMMTRAVNIPAAKPKKKVRFVLPAVEDCRGTW